MPDLKVGVNATVGNLTHTTITSHDPELKKKIVNVWKKVLCVDTVRNVANFFDIGGTSLKAMQVFEALKQLTQSPLALMDIFRFPTINSLSNHLGFEAVAVDSHAATRAQIRLRRMQNRKA